MCPKKSPDALERRGPEGQTPFIQAGLTNYDPLIMR